MQFLLFLVDNFTHFTCPTNLLYLNLPQLSGLYLSIDDQYFTLHYYNSLQSSRPFPSISFWTTMISSYTSLNLFNFSVVSLQFFGKYFILYTA